MSGGGPSFTSFKVSGPGSTIGDNQIESQSGGGQMGGGGLPGGTIACEFLVSRTKLESPVPGVASNLNPGDILAVILKKQVGFAGGFTLTATTVDGVVAGTLFPPNLARFIECMEHESVSYIARVHSVHGGRIIVEIRPASQINT